ncbi:MAG TPA: nitroreductase family protein [Acidobacteriota bacterium]|nr:nitroreductase family protein [Acidobacteriota bacterium]HNT16834.1 nitroreductase family protein [Acidobacteriota bacterium]
MDLEKLLRSRRSVRAYDERPFPEEFLDRILEAVRLAPTAGNVQAFRVKVVRDRGTKEALVPASFGQSFIAAAPVILAFMACPSESKEKYGSRGEKLYSLQDATIAVYTAHLMAEELGLGSCWIGAFKDEEVAQVLGLPKELAPVGLLPLGYAKDGPSAKKRKELAELLIG